MLIFLLSLLYCYQKEIENFEYERYKTRHCGKSTSLIEIPFSSSPHSKKFFFKGIKFFQYSILLNKLAKDEVLNRVRWSLVHLVSRFNQFKIVLHLFLQRFFIISNNINTRAL